MDLQKTIEEFKAYLEKIAMYGEAMSTLSFDSETIAPAGSIKARAKRAGFFSLEIFELITATKMSDYLQALAPHVETFDDVLKGEYRIAKQHYDENTKIPSAIVKELSELTEEATAIWKQARKADDFNLFAPYLKRLVDLKKQIITYRDTGKKPYDVFLDDYEAGMDMRVYDEFFDKLKDAIVPLLKKIQQSPKQIETSFTKTPVDLASQKQLAKLIADQVGYDLTCGYIAESTHPFCSGSNKYDVRITTRYDETDFLSSFYSVMHECGHAIYEQNVADAIAHTVLGAGVSMGIHESQSRFYENILGRSEPFWQAFRDEVVKFLPANLQSLTAKNFYEAVNQVTPSLIRVAADELTYNLHIIIRYEIERLLFAEEVDVFDLPQIWNQKYADYLGITPPTNTQGILQDIHWSFGAFGYFPTYALGSAYAAQIAFYLDQELDIAQAVKAQNFRAIKAWLNEKIHQHGKIYLPNQLMKKAFGEEFNVDYYINYLTKKYTNLYDLTPTCDKN